MSIAKNFGIALLVFGSVGVANADQIAGGYYAGGSLGRSFHKLDNETKANVDAFKGSSDMNKIGVKGFAGYNIDKFWSVEGGVAYLGKPTVSVPNAGITHSVTSSLTSFYAAGIYSFPVAPNFSVFGKAGLTINRSGDKGTDTKAATVVSRTSESSSKLAPMIGAGVSYDVDKNVAVRAELEYFGKMGKDADIRSSLLSVGVVYKF